VKKANDFRYTQSKEQDHEGNMQYIVTSKSMSKKMMTNEALSPKRVDVESGSAVLDPFALEASARLAFPHGRRLRRLMHPSARPWAGPWKWSKVPGAQCTVHVPRGYETDTKRIKACTCQPTYATWNRLKRTREASQWHGDSKLLWNNRVEAVRSFDLTKVRQAALR